MAISKQISRGSQGADGAAAPRDDLTLGTMIAYGLPSTGFGALGMLFGVYFMKFSTDVLLVAPAAIGLILGVGRIWDAISDPAAGYLSDRTKSPLGRRRSWMRAAAIPFALTMVMVWSPPGFLTGSQLILWLAIGLLVYETASTAFFVPYGALGMELTSDYHQRTRLFAYRHVLMAAGSALGLGGIFLLRTASAPRTMAFLLALGLGIGMAALILFATARLREKPDHQGRGAVNIYRAFSDVFRNQPGRLLSVVYGIETFGAASIGALAPYVMEYIVGAPELTEAFILTYFLPQVGFTPLWIRLARRFSKKNLWLFSMSAQAVAFFAVFWVGEGSYLLLFSIIFLLGVGGGCSMVVAPSIQADIIDYDELLTDQRKEGAYLAIWNLIRKGAYGISAMVAGFVLQYVGFEPNVEQSQETRSAMLALISILPGVCYVVGAVIFSRFGLNEAEHAEVMATLEARRQEPPTR